MLPRRSAKPINRLLRSSVEAMLLSSSMIEVAFCSMSLANGAASVASILAAGCSSIVCAIASALSCALRSSSSSGLDFLPQRSALDLERIVARDHPAPQRGERGVDSRHHIACGHRSRYTKIDVPVGGFVHRANLDDGDTDHDGQQRAEHAEAQNQPTSNIEM